MGLYQNLKDIINVLYNDEDLLRLLYNPPANLATNTLDPLDTSLPNILSMDTDTLANIRNERIYFSSKTDDLTPDKPINRIYVYAGRRKADGNYLMADQELVVDIFCHNDIENADLRSSRISDRLNQLLVDERITGLGKVNYSNGTPVNAPTQYVAFRHIYIIGGFRK